VTKADITTALGTDAILIATIDLPGRSMNVFSTDLMDSLERLLDEVAARADIRGVVITSGKPAFLAGADLEMVKGYTELAQHASHEELHQTCGRLGRLFLRLETLGKPFVAAIDGFALGGGLELALACHDRLATGNPTTHLGLPEVKLGLLPGAGGTQRLPRLIGTPTAFHLLLKGDSISAQRALELHLVSAIVSPETLVARARARAHELAQEGSWVPWDRAGWRAPENPFEFSARDVPWAIAREVGISNDDFTHYPAHRAIIDCVIGGWEKSVGEACRWEMDCFVRLIRDKVAGNMVRTLFLERQRAARYLPLRKTPTALHVAVEGLKGNPRALLSGASITTVEREQLPKNGLLLVTDAGTPAPRDLRRVAWLRGTTCSLAEFQLGTGIWVSDLTPHGRVVEVCTRGDDPAAAEAVLEIARALRATPLMTRGESLLQRLEVVHNASLHFPELEDRLLAIALAAARAWSAGSVPDVGVADTAAVIAGFHPAYTGGPFTYMRQSFASELRQRADRACDRYGQLFEVPERFDELLAAPPANG